MKKDVIKKYALHGLALTVLIPSLAVAASLEPEAAPSDPASAVYSTDDIYSRLQSGAIGIKRTGTFTEPTSGPADNATKTLDEIMDVAPAPDSSGLMPEEAPKGKAFWGLNTTTNGGRWGRQIGTASPAPVPRSGQTTCYNVTTNVATTCGASTPGQDGALQKGVALPSPRFTNNNNGTVTDNKTGLIWLTNANCLETVGSIAKPSPGYLTWPNALTWSNNLANGKCGLSDGSAVGDWRLPNREELASLVNAEYYSPSLSNTAGTAKWSEGAPFSGVLSNFYWSSTTYAEAAAYAWRVYFSFGHVDANTKANSYYVWPVRGGQY